MAACERVSPGLVCSSKQKAGDETRHPLVSLAEVGDKELDPSACDLLPLVVLQEVAGLGQATLHSEQHPLALQCALQLLDGQ